MYLKTQNQNHTNSADQHAQCAAIIMHAFCSQKLQKSLRYTQHSGQQRSSLAQSVEQGSHLHR